jgi:hypothetical protein
MPATQTQPVTQQQLAEALDKFRLQLLADIQALVPIPFDDEPVTEDERAAVQEALAEVQAGAKCYTTEELNRELGL